MPDTDGPEGPESLPALRSELRERSKELGFLHHATRLLHTRGEPRDTLRAVLELVPGAMCYPELAGARLVVDALELRTQGYRQSELCLRAEFPVGGVTGFVEVCYATKPPSGPAFLEEEKSLLGSLAELLRAHFEIPRAEASPRPDPEQSARSWQAMAGAELGFRALQERFFPPADGRARAAEKVVAAVIASLPTPQLAASPGIYTLQVHAGDNAGREKVYEIGLGPARVYLAVVGGTVRVGADAPRLAEVTGLEYRAATQSYDNGIRVVAEQLVELLERQLASTTA